MPASHERGGRRLALGAAGLALIAGSLASAGAASAALLPVPTLGEDGGLMLRAEPYPLELDGMSPGEPVHWQIEASQSETPSATLRLELEKSGALVEHPNGLELEIAECAERWTGLDTTPSCGSGARRVLRSTPQDGFATADSACDPVDRTCALADLRWGDPVYLLVTLSIADTAAARADPTLMGLRGELGIGLTALEADPAAFLATDPEVDPGPPRVGAASPPLLAGTGLDAAFPAMLAAALLASGIAALLAARRGA